MKQILIVEDDNLLNKTLAYNLASDDYAITNVLNARAAAEALKAKSFDLVFWKRKIYFSRSAITVRNSVQGYNH